MIKQLAHICIHSNDLAKTEKFYCEGLGLEKGFEFIKEEECIGFYLKFGNQTFIEVFKGDPPEVGNINHFALETEQMDQLIENLNSLGYKATDKILGEDHSWQSWTTDPNGVRIEFHQYTEKSLQIKGGICSLK